MAKGKKRKPDLRKIRTSKVYRLASIAKTLDRDIRTVRNWVKRGLPVLKGPGPALIDGDELKNWLQAESDALKQKCLENEFYCLKCRKPQNAREGSFSFHARNAKTLTLKALCGVCGTRVNKAASSANLAVTQAHARPVTPVNPHLQAYGNPGLIVHFSDEGSSDAVEAVGGGQKLPALDHQTSGKLH